MAAGGTTDPKNVLSPCGLIVDWIRSAYRVAMVCRIGDPAVLVDWYFCDPGAKPMDVWSSFRSRNWDGRDATAGQLGEQPGVRPWKNGKKPKNGYTGDANSQNCIRYHADWWKDGLGAGEETGPFNANGVPLCCVNGPPVTCSDAAFDILSAEIIDLAGCGNLGQPSALERIDPGICKWLCTFDITGMTTAAAAVEYVGSNTWELTTTCHTGTVISSAPFMPGQVIDFDVDDDFPCCDQGSPPRSFRLRVTVPS